MLYLGIDPGNTGACCIYDDRLKFIDFIDCPVRVIPLASGKQTNQIDSDQVSTELKILRRRYLKISAIVEAQASYGMGSQSAFNYGINYGTWLALLTAHSIPYHLVWPQTWTKDLSKSGGKDESLQLARSLYPEVAASHLKRKKDNGRADALLLVHWYLNCYKNVTT